MENKSLVVMVVEDEDLLLTAITKKLELMHKSVIACLSGDEAINKLKNTTKLPDVIWLDYYLKDMNGLEFMAQLKDNPEWQNIPVMVVSNSASTDKVTKMLALGAKKYMLKAESKLDDLVAMIEEVAKV
jgi:CheY-like chemotaxis protein